MLKLVNLAGRDQAALSVFRRYRSDIAHKGIL